MTTIAYRDGIMAADSQMRFDGYGKARCSSKLYRVGDAVIGGAGESNDINRFIKWYAGGKQGKFKAKKSFDALVATPKGLEYWDNAQEPEPIVDPYFAIGSGARFALGAMAVGADAAAAIEAAKGHDPYTGFEVVTMAVASE